MENEYLPHDATWETLLWCGHDMRPHNIYYRVLTRHSTWERTMCTQCFSHINNNPHRMGHIVKHALIRLTPSGREHIAFGSWISRDGQVL